MPSFVNYKKGCTRLATASDKVYQLLAHGRWFSRASSTTKTGHHDIAEILLKVAFNTKFIQIQNLLPVWYFMCLVLFNMVCPHSTLFHKHVKTKIHVLSFYQVFFSIVKLSLCVKNKVNYNKSKIT